MATMKDMGIQTSWHYPPVHTFSSYAKDMDLLSFTLPLTEALAAREVTLPLYPSMTEEQVGWVVEALVHGSKLFTNEQNL
jgi:dTDP-4-amino-4,6-dideoxygalactose transaminase